VTGIWFVMLTLLISAFSSSILSVFISGHLAFENADECQS